MSERWFLTGTDTEVGKTFVSCVLLEAAKRAGKRVAGYKPVASGSERLAEGLRNGDALALQAASSPALGYDEVNPYVFAEPTSPHIASRAESLPIDMAVMSAGLAALTRRADWILVEGAGGWFTPLSDVTLFSDWVKQEHLPVILVVGVKLGCINHALLTAQAVRQAGLRLGGWIANCVQPPGARHGEYMTTLRALLPAPLLGEIPFAPQAGPASLASFLELPRTA